MPGSALSNDTGDSSYTNFTDDEAETQRLSNLSKIDQGMNGEIRVQMQTCLTSKSRPLLISQCFLNMNRKYIKIAQKFC